MYKLDLATILQLLREFLGSGTLQAQLPNGLPNRKEAGWVLIELSRGEVISSCIKSHDGRILLIGHDVLNVLAPMGAIDWLFEPSSHAVDVMSRTASMQAKMSLASPIPRQVLQVRGLNISTLSRKHRQVFVLIDGERSIAKIAGILSQSPRAVEAVIRELQAMGMVSL